VRTRSATPCPAHGQIRPKVKKCNQAGAKKSGGNRQVLCKKSGLHEKLQKKASVNFRIKEFLIVTYVTYSPVALQQRSPEEIDRQCKAYRFTPVFNVKAR
jgi:hypothetical protein